MRRTLRWFALLTVMLLALSACTRERPTPEAIPTDEPTTESVAEPAVVEVTAEAVDSVPSEDPADVETPTPEAEEEVSTFQYTVEEGDTLLEIALRFGTDTETIRRLNNLFSDEIQVGLPLNVPYVEGVVVPGQPTPTPGPYPYAVQPGDTIGSIALKFGKDMIELIEANNLIESDILSVGQEILIPDYSPTVADPPSTSTGDAGIDATVTHVVQEGETLGDIAELYGVDSASIIRFNNIANPNVLRLGQSLQIPGVNERDAAALRGDIHVVQTGESLSQIAAQYGVDVEQIISANGLNNPNEIRVGQELVIPR